MAKGVVRESYQERVERLGRMVSSVPPGTPKMLGEEEALDGRPWGDLGERPITPMTASGMPLGSARTIGEDPFNGQPIDRGATPEQEAGAEVFAPPPLWDGDH